MACRKEAQRPAVILINRHRLFQQRLRRDVVLPLV
jgi:hypothetical protein